MKESEKKQLEVARCKAFIRRINRTRGAHCWFNMKKVEEKSCK